MNRSSIRTVLVYLFICGGILLSAGSLYALENTFKISASVVAVDNDAPSVPTGLVATPVSSSQVNLVWNVSTDNVAVAGYRVYREGLFVATSSTPTFTDIGLFPSTLYSYKVDAFDAQFNFSGQSATTSVTTLPVPTSNTDSPRPRSSRLFDQNTTNASGVTVFTERESAVIAWNTPDFARANVYWGQSNDYELGTISGVIFQKNHVVKIENLIPDTQYFYRIELESNNGNINIYEGSFVTQKDQLTRPIQSSVLTAEAHATSIRLMWNKVTGETQQVRIVRSDKFFPIDPYDGKVVYQGARDNQFVDTAVEEGVTYYYALFVVDADEAYSAPAIAKASIGKDQNPVFSDTIYSGAYETLLKDITIADFDFIQKGVELSFSAGGLNLSARTATEIRIDGAKIPLGIKTIGVTFVPTKASAQAATFLLSYSKERDMYIGLIPPLESGQTYEIDITIFDSLNERVKTIHVAARVEVELQKDYSPNIILQLLGVAWDNKLFTIIILLLGFILGFVARRL